MGFAVPSPPAHGNPPGLGWGSRNSQLFPGFGMSGAGADAAGWEFPSRSFSWGKQLRQAAPRREEAPASQSGSFPINHPKNSSSKIHGHDSVRKLAAEHSLGEKKKKDYPVFPKHRFPPGFSGMFPASDSSQSPKFLWEDSPAPALLPRFFLGNEE